MSSAGQPSSNRIPPERRLAEIVACATELFASRGFTLTTMDDIAEAAGITKRTLYRYVTSKDELLYDIHDSFTDQALTVGDPDDNDDVIRAFKRIVTKHVGLVTDHQKEISVFFDERKHLTGQRARLIERRRDANETYAVSVIQAGIDQGYFTDLSARPVAQAILGALTETFRWYKPEGPLSSEQLSERYIDLFLNGAATDRSRSLPPPPTVRYGKPVRDESAADKVRAAAISEFARVGYHAASMREVADVADVTKGAVMYHAGYKNKLLEDIHRTTVTEGTEVVLSIRPEEGDAVDALYRALVAHLVFLAPNRAAIEVLNGNLRYLNPAARTRITRLQGKWIKVYRDMVERGIADGTLRDLGAGFLTRSLVGILNSTARWYDPKGRLGPGQLADVYAPLFFFGLTATPGRE